MLSGKWYVISIARIDITLLRPNVNFFMHQSVAIHFYHLGSHQHCFQLIVPQLSDVLSNTQIWKAFYSAYPSKHAAIRVVLTIAITPPLSRYKVFHKTFVSFSTDKCKCYHIYQNKLSPVWSTPKNTKMILSYSCMDRVLAIRVPNYKF